jgi:hypothetical protein
MTQFRYSLLSLATGLVLAGVPLIGVVAGRLDAWSALCLLIGLGMGALAGGLVERYRPVRPSCSKSRTVESAETNVFHLRQRQPEARSHRA